MNTSTSSARTTFVWISLVIAILVGFIAMLIKTRLGIPVGLAAFAVTFMLLSLNYSGGSR